jgi:hypothetical protein
MGPIPVGLVLDRAAPAHDHNSGGVAIWRRGTGLSVVAQWMKRGLIKVGAWCLPVLALEPAHSGAGIGRLPSAGRVKPHTGQWKPIS